MFDEMEASQASVNALRLRLIVSLESYDRAWFPPNVSSNGATDIENEKEMYPALSIHLISIQASFIWIRKVSNVDKTHV